MRSHAKLLALVLLVPTLAAFTGCMGKIDDSDIRFVGVDELAELEAKDLQRDSVLLLIDPRPSAEYDAAHLPRAVNLQLTDITNRYGVDPEINKHDHLIVYGFDAGSAVARAMAKRMMTIGYSKKKVRWYKGGLREWTQAGFETESETDGAK